MILRSATLLSLLHVFACAHGATPEAPAAAPSTARQATYDELVKAARAYVDSGRPERGIEVAQKAVAQAPDRPEAYAVWGKALATSRELVAAARQYEKARALGSDDRDVFVELSSVYDVGGAYERAVQVYEDWLTRHPDDGEMHHELGLSLLIQERFAAAVGPLTAAKRLLPNELQPREDLAYALLGDGKPEQAAAELEAVLSVDQSRTDALRLYAQARAAQGATADALALLDRLLTRAPDDTRGRRVRARLRQLTGDASGALEDYVSVLAKTPSDAGALLGASGAYLELGRLADAQATLERAQKAAGDVPELRFRLAQLALAQGEKGALARLAAAARELPKSFEAWRLVLAAAERAKDKALVKEAQGQLDALR